jgi:hypothetical protein
MNYYLIDEKKVRSLLENILVRGNIRVTDVGGLLVESNNVHYEVAPRSLDVMSATPLNENAVAITKNGLVSWKNHYVKVLESKDSGPEVNTEITNFKYVATYKPFCSGFICLGKTPSDDAIKITASSIKIYYVPEVAGSKEKVKVYSPSEAKFKITETQDSLIIEKKRGKLKGRYEIGVVANDLMYVIDDFPMYYNYLKVVIPRGTCFETYQIYNIANIEKPKVYSADQSYELCYE